MDSTGSQRFERLSEFKTGLNSERGTQKRRDEQVDIRKKKRYEKLHKRRFVNYRVEQIVGETPMVDEHDPLQREVVTRERFVDMMQKYNPICIVDQSEDCATHVKLLSSMLRFFDNRLSFGEAMLPMITDLENPRPLTIHPTKAYQFTQSLPAVTNRLIQLLDRPHTQNTQVLQQHILLILKQISSQRQPFQYQPTLRTWGNIMLDAGMAKVAMSHLSHTEDSLARGYCLLILGNIAMESNNARDRILGHTDLFLKVIRKNMPSQPYNAIWCLSAMFERYPVPPLEFTKRVWDIIMHSISKTKVEETLPPEQVDFTEAALKLFFHAVRNADESLFVPYISAICHDDSLMQQLFYFAKHENTPLGIAMASTEILRLLPKNVKEHAYLIQKGYLKHMFVLLENSSRKIRGDAVFAFGWFAEQKELMPVLCNAELLRCIVSGLQYESGRPKLNYVKLLCKMIATCLRHNLEPEMRQMLSFYSNHKGIVHGLAEMILDDYINCDESMLRFISILIMLTKDTRYQAQVLNELEDVEADVQLSLRYDRCQNQLLSSKYETMLDLMDHRHEDDDDVNELQEMSLTQSMAGGYHF